MITVVAQISSQENGASAIREILEELLGSSRNESGCNSYKVFQNDQNPLEFLTIENWADQASADAHLASPMWLRQSPKPYLLRQAPIIPPVCANFIKTGRRVIRNAVERRAESGQGNRSPQYIQIDTEIDINRSSQEVFELRYHDSTLAPMASCHGRSTEHSQPSIDYRRASSQLSTIRISVVQQADQFPYLLNGEAKARATLDESNTNPKS